MILVELVVCVVILVEKGERDVCLGSWINRDMTGLYTIGFHKVDDEASHLIVAGFGDHRGGKSASAKTDERVESGATWHGFLRLIVAEDDVVDGFSYAVDVTHKAELKLC